MKRKFILILLLLSVFINYNIVDAQTEEDLSQYRTEENKIPGELYLNPKWIEWNNLSEEEKSKWEVIPNKLIRDYVYEKEESIMQPFSEKPELNPIYKSLPSSYNLKDYGYVSPIKNQGSLGLCWSFATIGAIESTALKTLNKSLIFSERQVDYALSNPETSITEGYNPYGSEWRTLGDGGNFSDFNKLFVSGISPQLTSVWGSYSTTISTKKLSTVIDDSLVSYSITGTEAFPYLDVTTATDEEKKAFRDIIKEHITTYGGVYVGTIVPDSRSGSCYNSSYNMIYQTEDCVFSDENPYHAMLIIGWNDTYGPDYDGDGVGDGAWILKNSWGSSDHPYPYLSYNSIDVGYEAISSIEAKDYNNVYDFSDRHYIERISTTSKNYVTRVTFYNSQEDSEILNRIIFNSNYTGDVKFYLENSDGSELFLGEYIREITDGIRAIDINNIPLPLDKFIIRIESEDYFYMDYYGFYTTRNVDSNTKTVETRFDSNSVSADITSSSYINLTIHSITNNILSGEKLDYKIYNSNGEDITNIFTFDTENNYIINNNSETMIYTRQNNLEYGDYRIDTFYNNSKVDEYNFTVSTIKINKITITTNNINKYIGDTYYIKTTISPSNAFNKILKYESSNPTVATIDDTGKVTALSAGTTTITVSTTDGSNLSETTSFNVLGYKVTSLTFENSSYELYTKDTLTLNPTVLPENAYNKKIRYTSSDTSIATVDENGKVTGHNTGSVKITATTTDGTNLSKTISINVYTSITDIKLESESYDLLTTHGFYLSKKIEFLPSNSYNKELIYESSDANIATVTSSGFVTAVGVGTATITITTTDGSNISKEININVLGNGIKDINIEAVDFDVFKNKSRNLREYLYLTPSSGANVYDDSLIYESRDESIAVVDEEGNVTGISEGATTIIVSSPYGENVSKWIHVDVVENLEGEGTKENPYKIYDVYDLDKIRVDPHGIYSIENDLEFLDADYSSDGYFYNSAKYWLPIYDFKGVLEGNNFTINNLKITGDTYSDTGLAFILNTENAVIKNLNISNANIIHKRNGDVSGLVANSIYSTFNNISLINSTITTTGDISSGLIKNSSNDNIINCKIDSVVSSDDLNFGKSIGLVYSSSNSFIFGAEVKGEIEAESEIGISDQISSSVVLDSYTQSDYLDKGTNYSYQYGMFYKLEDSLVYNSYSLNNYYDTRFKSYPNSPNYILYGLASTNRNSKIINFYAEDILNQQITVANLFSKYTSNSEYKQNITKQMIEGTKDENDKLNFCGFNNCSDYNVWSLKNGESFITPEVSLPSYESATINISLNEEINGNEFYPFNKLLEYGFATIETNGVPIGLNETNNFVVCPNKDEECNIGDGPGTIEIISTVGNNLKLKRTFSVSYTKMEDFKIYSNIKNGNVYIEENLNEQKHNDNIIINQGDIIRINVDNILPSTADFKKLKFNLENDDLFNVISTTETAIELEAKAAGSTKLSISTDDGSNITKQVNLTIIGKSIKLSGPTLDPNPLYDYIGGKVNLTATLENITADKVTVDVYKEGYDNLISKNFTVTNNVANIELDIPDAIPYGIYTINVVAGDYSAEETFEVTEYIHVKSVELNKESLELLKGKDETLKATPNADAINKKITWTSSNEKVATVDENGKVTAVGRGTATITVTSEDGGKTASCEVKVLEPKITLGEKTTNSNYDGIIYAGYGGTVNIPITTQDIEEESKLTLNYYKNDVEMTNAEVSNIFEIDGNVVNDNKVNLQIEVNSSALEGTYKIEVSSEHAETKSFEFDVIAPILVESIEADNITLLKDGPSEEISYRINPDSALNKNVTYKIDDETIATIEDGKIKGLKVGQTTLTITSKDGSNISKTINVNVVEKKITLSEPTLEPTTIYNESGGKVTLTATLENMTENEVTVDVYKEDSKSIITKNCTVTNNVADIELDIPKNIEKGTYTIMVTAGEIEATKTFKVTEYIHVSSVELNKESLELLKANAETLKVTINPTEAINKKVTWTSSNEKVATVDQNGEVTAVGRGTATITVKSEDGEYTDSCEVKVLEPKITLGEKTTSSNYDDILYEGYGGTVTLPITRQDISDEDIIGLQYYKKDGEVFKQITDIDTINKIHNSSTVHENNNTTLTFDISSKLEAGNYKVELFYNNSNRIYFEFEVKKPILVESIEAENITLSDDGTLKNIDYSIKPDNALNKNVEISIEDETIATIEDGKIKGLKVGQTTLTITSKDGSNISKTININVVEKTIVISDIKLENDIIYETIGGKINFRTSLINIDSNKINIDILNSNKDKVYSQESTINEKGYADIEIDVPKSLASGIYTIKAYTENFETTATFKITTYKEVNNLKFLYNQLELEKLTLLVTDEINITTNIENDDSTFKEVTYSIKDSNIATVEDGTIKGLLKGNTELIAKVGFQEFILPIEIINVPKVIYGPLNIYSNIKENKKIDNHYGGKYVIEALFDNIKAEKGIKYINTINKENNLMQFGTFEFNANEIQDRKALLEIQFKEYVSSELSSGLSNAIEGTYIVNYSYTINDTKLTELTDNFEIDLKEYKKLTAINTSKDNITIKIKESININNIVTYTPIDATNKNVKYEISNGNILGNDNGTITGLSCGTAIVKIISIEDENILKEISVKVEKNNYLEFISKINIHNVNNSKYLKGLEASNDYKDLKNSISTNMDMILKESNGIRVTNNSSILKTGMKLTIGEDTYDIVIRGDISGDGKMSITDLSQMRYHLAVVSGKIKTGAYEQAGDMNNSNTLTITDLSRMRKELAN